MSKVVLIGTSHSIQRDHSRVDFSDLINKTIIKHSVKAIAEEIDVNDSVVSGISNNLGIEYKIIEPNEQERIALGIDSLNQIEFGIIMDFEDSESPEAIAECKVRKQSTFRDREQEWLRRIGKMKGSLILVVCGANHVSAFAKLLKKNNIGVVIENAHWELSSSTNDHTR